MDNLFKIDDANIGKLLQKKADVALSAKEKYNYPLMFMKIEEIKILSGKYYHFKYGKYRTNIELDGYKRKRINLEDVQNTFSKYGSKKGDFFEIQLKNYKILGRGEIKGKFKITAWEASNSAIQKVKKAGGEIILLKNAKKNSEKPEKPAEK